jgi:hypothetical protein
MDPNKVVNDLLEDNKEWANEMTSDFFAGLPNPQEPKVCPAPRRMHALESLYTVI